MFSGVASETYQANVFTAAASGHVQVDQYGRLNMVWNARQTIGFSMQGGQFIAALDAVKAVCFSNRNKVHGFPIDAQQLASARCLMCGAEIKW